MTPAMKAYIGFLNEISLLNRRYELEEIELSKRFSFSLPPMTDKEEKEFHKTGFKAAHGMVPRTEINILGKKREVTIVYANDEYDVSVYISFLRIIYGRGKTLKDAIKDLRAGVKTASSSLP